MPISMPPWLPGGPYHVSCPSLRFENGVWLEAGPRNGHNGPLWSSSSSAVPPLLCRWLLEEDRISLVAFSILSDPQGSGPGSLLSIYTSWKRPLISSWEVQYPTSWMAGTSTSGSSLRRPCQHPWQVSLSASFHPDSAASTNFS